LELSSPRPRRLSRCTKVSLSSTLITSAPPSVGDLARPKMVSYGSQAMIPRRLHTSRTGCTRARYRSPIGSIVKLWKPKLSSRSTSSPIAVRSLHLQILHLAPPPADPTDLGYTLRYSPANLWKHCRGWSSQALYDRHSCNALGRPEHGTAGRGLGGRVSSRFSQSAAGSAEAGKQGQLHNVGPLPVSGTFREGSMHVGLTGIQLRYGGRSAIPRDG